MHCIEDIYDDKFVNIDNSRKVVRHRRLNFLMIVTIIVCGYFTYGKCNELLEQSKQMEA